jgi:hypothetical protein
MKPSETFETHEILMRIAAYLDVFGGVIVVLFMAATVLLPIFLPTLMPGYSIAISTSGGLTSIASSINLLSLSLSLGNAGYYTIAITSITLYGPGPPITSGPGYGIGFNSFQFGSLGIVLVIITLLLGVVAVITGLVSRNHPGSGGAVMIILVIMLLSVGTALLLVVGVPNPGLVTVIGTIPMAVGGIISLAVSRL